MEVNNDQLNKLFPKPLPAPTSFPHAPTRIPEATPDSADALVECLKDNHVKQHIFFNERHFHNHATHHLLAIYAMGAPRQLLDVTYQTHVVYQRPAFPSPGPIDASNWKDHFADENYYQAYAAFFANELFSKGPAAVLEQYIFSKDANLTPGKSGEKPYLLSRYLGGLLHPFIHSGYGAEFGQYGMWAEGLAEACVQSPQPPSLIPNAMFDPPASATSSSFLARVASLTVSSSTKPEAASPHALTILARLAQDSELKPSALGLPPKSEQENPFNIVVDKCGAKLLAVLDEWTVGTSIEELTKKMEELWWMNTVLYTVGGWWGRNQSDDEHKEFNADFPLMHLVTSSIFLPTTMAHLTPATSSLLLRSYFITSLVAWIARGRPVLPIAEFYASTTAWPSPPGPQPKPSEKTFRELIASPTDDPDKSQELWRAVSDTLTPNPWLAIMQTTLVHPNEHLCKLQRSLAHYANVLGETSAGTFAHLGSEGGLDGVELLDGTLFIRAAGLSANRLGWMREGQPERGFDFNGFFKEQ